MDPRYYRPMTCCGARSAPAANAVVSACALAGVLLAGCSSTGLVGAPALSLCTEVGPVDRLTVTVLDRHGALLIDEPLPADGRPPSLPGVLRFDVGTRTGTVRVLVTGWVGVQPVGFAAAQLELPHGNTRACLRSYPADRDDDGIPDDEDGCPRIPDPAQRDADGDGVTDLCAAAADGGVDAGLADGAADGGGDGAAADGAACASGAACDDGDPCTTGDLCDLDGECRGFAAPDGHACGALPSRRCCKGRCVNIATDENHCGSCGAKCAAGFSCQSVGKTDFCNFAPEETSGRCKCTSPAHCAFGQACRSETPGANLCSPYQPEHCPAEGSAIKWQGMPCPNYCHYK